MALCLGHYLSEQETGNLAKNTLPFHSRLMTLVHISFNDKYLPNERYFLGSSNSFLDSGLTG